MGPARVPRTPLTSSSSLGVVSVASHRKQEGRRHGSERVRGRLNTIIGEAEGWDGGGGGGGAELVRGWVVAQEIMDLHSILYPSPCKKENIVQELCESRGGRPGLSVLTSLLFRWT